MEVRNRFKGLDLIDRVPEELWMEVCDPFRGIFKGRAYRTLWLNGPVLVMKIALDKRTPQSLRQPSL